jgi:hypothetical protein
MHGSLIDYRFRVRNMRPQNSTSVLKDGDTFIENGILVELKYVDLEDSPETQLRRKGKSSKWYPNNVAEYLFFDNYGFLNINEKQIRSQYDKYTKTMMMVYDNIKVLYNKFAKEALTEKDLLKQADLKLEITH